MKIGIIIPTFNRKTYLFGLLASIRKLKMPVGVTIHTIVVVDGSKDGTVEMLQTKFGDVFIVLGDGSWWWTKSINKGIDKAIELNVTHVLLMNDDNLLPENYLDLLLNDFKPLPQIAVLGSASVSISASNTIDAAGYYKFNKLLFKLYPYKKSGSIIDHTFSGVHKSCALSGRGTLIPITVIQQVGLLDESLIQYGSDDDFTMRCTQQQIPVFISWNARVFNYSEITSKERDRKSATITDLIKANFNPYSSSALKKEFILYSKHSYKLIAPFYCCYLFLAGLLLHLRHKLIVTS
jgi:N-acetylglucosaminyl-diphospho-decaprenol L-rhamnosyltransferase